MVEMFIRSGNGRERERSKGSKIEEAVLESGRMPGSSVCWETSVRLLRFLVGVIVTAVSTSFARVTMMPASAKSVSRPITWAEYIQEKVRRTNSRRFEHPIHAAVCRGEWDHLYSPERRAARRARCAKICGLCRYLDSARLWPDPKYRRPPQTVLDALETQPYHS
jgi:hypothetical protein